MVGSGLFHLLRLFFLINLLIMVSILQIILFSLCSLIIFHNGSLCTVG